MIKPEAIGVFDYEIIPASGLLPKMVLGLLFCYSTVTLSKQNACKY